MNWNLRNYKTFGLTIRYRLIRQMVLYQWLWYGFRGLLGINLPKWKSKRPWKRVWTFGEGTWPWPGLVAMHLTPPISMKLNRLEEAFLLVTEVQCIVILCHATWSSPDLVGYSVAVVRPERSMTTRDGRWFVLRVFIRHLFFPFSFLGLVAVALTGAICSGISMERCWEAAIPRYPVANGSTTKTWPVNETGAICSALEISR